MNAVTPIVAARPAAFAPVAFAAPAAVWSGRPAWMSSALRVWKVRWAAAYFALLLADGAWIARGPRAPVDAWSGEGRLLAAAGVLLGGLLALAALTRRTTRYEIGPHAVTLRYGMALPATLVIPFAAIEHVGVRIHRDGTGDVALRLKPGPRVIYPKLWPHARPWRFSNAEPMLRCIPDAGVAAALLCRALAAQEPPALRRQEPTRASMPASDILARPLDEHA